MIRRLFDGALAPITNTIGFLEVPTSVAAQCYVDWFRDLFEKDGGKLTIWDETVTGDLKTVLLRLLPLTTGRERYLFIPTTSTWTAFFDNYWRGSDAASAMRVMAEKLKCRGVRCTVVPHTYRKKRGEKIATGHYGAVILEMYGPDRKHIRTICSANDGGKWVFHQSGTPWPFECLESYEAPRKRDRFTSELLEAYLKEFSLSVFDEQFYLPPEKPEAVLISKTLAPTVDLKEYSLEDLQQ